MIDSHMEMTELADQIRDRDEKKRFVAFDNKFKKPGEDGPRLGKDKKELVKSVESAELRLKNQDKEKTEKKTRLWTAEISIHLNSGKKFEDQELSEEWTRFLKDYHGVDDEISFKKNLSKEKYRDPDEDEKFNDQLISDFVFWREQKARALKADEVTEEEKQTPAKVTEQLTQPKIESAKAAETPKPVEKLSTEEEKRKILLFLDKTRLEKQTEGNGKEGDRVKKATERFVKACRRPDGITKIILGVDGKKLSALIIRIDNGDTLAIPIHTLREVFLGINPLSDRQVKNPKSNADGTTIGIRFGALAGSPYIFPGTSPEILKEIFEKIRIDGKKIESNNIEFSKTSYQYMPLQG